MSNSIGEMKLKYDDIRDLILAEQVRRKDSTEILSSGFALNVGTRGMEHDILEFRNRSKSKSRFGSRSLTGIVVRLVTTKEIDKIQKN